MQREESRNKASGYCARILIVNGKVRDDLSQKLFYIRNISKGGFCFIADIELEIEDRVRVVLEFPDEHSQEVLGRICYCNAAERNADHAYGFSVIDGFYSLNSNRAGK